MKSETAWQASIDYKACGEAVGSKAKMIRARGARSTIRAAGYMTTFVCSKQEEAASLAREITEATGVPMRVDEVVTCLWDF